MKVEKAIEELLKKSHPKFKDRKMTKFYIAKLVNVMPSMIDRWLRSDYVGLSDRVVKAFKENFNIDLKGHQSVMFVEDGVLKASSL